MSTTPTAITLTAAQQAALEAEGDVLVAAAAGSGKTRVLTGRIVRAITEQGVSLDAIVAVTFTEKAAQEIRSRVAARCHELARHDLVASLEHAMIGTIHGLCGRLLRRYGAAIGIDPGFSVLDASHAAWLRHRAATLALEDVAGSGDALRIRARYGDRRLVQLVLAAWDAAAQRVDRRVQLAVESPDADAVLLDALLVRMSQRYDEACRAAGGIDFDDLQHHALAALRVDDVRLDVRSRVQRVLVDEFQDTNSLQCAIIDAIGPGCTFAVGDEWQSIYRFRAADVRVFRERSAAIGALPMRDNFRSSPAVLEVVNGLFGGVFGERYQPVVAGLDDHPNTADGAPACQLLLAAPERGDQRALETALVADRIAALVAAGTDPGTIAVLLPRQTHGHAFEQALTERGVPTLRAASRGYYAQRAVADVTDLLQLVRNLRDERAALAVLAGPFGALTPRELLALRRRSRELEPAAPGLAPTIWDAAVDTAGSGDARCAQVVGMVHELVGVARDGGLVDVVDHAVHGTGHDQRVLAGPDGLRRYANLRKLVELAAAARAGGIDDLGRYLDLVSGRHVPPAEGDATLADEAAGSVRILTVHASKGLEFDHVFVADAANQGRRDHPSLLVDDDGTAAFVHMDDDGIEQVVPDALESLRSAEAAAALEEEQRLMYVALTRARSTLTISGSLARQKAGLVARGPLGWLLEALELDPDDAVAGERVHHPDMPIAMEVHEAAPVPVTVAATDAGVLTAQVVPETWSPPVVADASAPAVHPRPLGTAPDTVTDPDATADGVALHRWLARALTTGSTPGLESLPDHLHGRALAVGASPTFIELVAAGARAEVEWCMPAAGAAGGVTSGRFDALAILDDGATWWIHDHKLTLPADADAAWQLHGDQLTRYADAAFAAGAERVRLSLQSAADPQLVHRYDLTPSTSTVPAPPGGAPLSLFP